MKTLNTRIAIAKALNFKNDLVVLEMDVANEIILGGDLVCGYQGCIVNKDVSRDYYIRGKVQYFKDTKKVTFSENPVCLSNSFGYYDIKEMLEYRKAPVIVKGCTIVLVVYNSKTGMALSPVEFEYQGGNVILDDAEWIEKLEA